MASRCTLTRRTVSPTDASFLVKAFPNFTELERNLWASRNAAQALKPIPAWLSEPLLDLTTGAARLLVALQKNEKIVVIADYDCDGATACAVMVSGLRALGANIGFVVPDRMVHGYGISPSVVDLAKERFPNANVLVTVDNGILGHSGITHANKCGLDVIVTDHHLPGTALPDALAVINPSRDDEDKSLAKLAGCGVALWLVAEVKRLMVQKGMQTPSLNFLMPYVAVGTVADMVVLDNVNRQLVSVGLDRMRMGQAPVGVLALLAESGASLQYLTSQDIGFGVSPRINAAGRLESMELGIDLLLEQDPGKAAKLAKLLSETNAQRKLLQKEATEEAAVSVDFALKEGARSIVRGSTDWHPGIVGLVASRLKDAHNLPTFVFSLAAGMAKGSGRSIPGFHLKDAMEEIARRDPHILAKFGGHAMAAGATLTGPGALPEFERHLEAVAQERIDSAMLKRTLLSDGPVPDLTLDEAARILRHPWGQGFEAPAFDDEARIKSVTPLGKDGLHWKVQAQFPGKDGGTTVVLFNHDEPAEGSSAHFYMQPSLNSWRDHTNVQWLGKIIH